MQPRHHGQIYLHFYVCVFFQQSPRLAEQPKLDPSIKALIEDKRNHLKCWTAGDTNEPAIGRMCVVRWAKNDALRGKSIVALTLRKMPCCDHSAITVTDWVQAF